MADQIVMYKSNYIIKFDDHKYGIKNYIITI